MQPHTLTGTSRVEETCAFDGKIIYECTTCGGTKEEVLKATGNHTWSRQPVGEHGGYNHKDATIMTCDVCGQFDYKTAEVKYTPYETAEIMLGYINELRYETYGTHEYDLVLSEELMEMAEVRAAEMPTLWNTEIELNSGENAARGACSIEKMYNVFNSTLYGPMNEKMLDKNFKYFGFYMYIDTSEYQLPTYAVFEYGSD